MTRRLRPNEVRRSLRRRFSGCRHLVDMYIREVEHQEGTRFWGDNFSSLADIAHDFNMYVKGRYQ